MLNDPVAREVAAAALGAVVDEVATEHFWGLTQEHQLTSKIADRLEHRLAGVEVFPGCRISVVSQDIPDRGSASLEKRLGADLYIGITVNGPGLPISKGLLVQAKWRDSFTRRRERGNLAEQAANALEATPASYVWLCGPHGVRVLHATQVTNHPDQRPESLRSRSPARMFSGVLRCHEGDPAIGLSSFDSPTRREALGAMLEELGAREGIAIKIATGE